MALDPAQEREEMHRKYPSFSRTELAWTVLGLAVLLILDRFYSIDWWAYALGFVSLISWELTKYRPRRNADRFAAGRP